MGGACETGAKFGNLDEKYERNIFKNFSDYTKFWSA